MVPTHLKNISQHGNLPQIEVKIKNLLKPTTTYKCPKNWVTGVVWAPTYGGPNLPRLTWLAFQKERIERNFHFHPFPVVFAVRFRVIIPKPPPKTKKKVDPESTIWVFPKIGISQNGWFISWKTLLKLMIWGFSIIFGNTPFKENEKYLETTNFCVKLQGCFTFFPFQKNKETRSRTRMYKELPA